MVKFLAYCFLVFFFSSSKIYPVHDQIDVVSAKIISPVTGTGEEASQMLGLFIPVPDGWKLYGPHSNGKLGYPPSIRWTKKTNLKNLKILWPKEETFFFQGTTSSGYRKDTLIPIEIEMKKPTKDLLLEGVISYLICENVCVPKTANFHFHLPNGPKFSSKDAPLFSALTESEFQNENLWIMLFFAFVGGFILNFMPCVLPVLSLKIVSLAQKIQDKKMIRVSSSFTFLGILVSFLVLGVISSVFKISGEVFQWGGQFQSPYFLLFMTSIIFLFAANLWGVFEIGQGIVSKIPVINHRTIIADLWNGFIAVFLATPCSAPFLGTALSFTLSQSEPIIFLIFTCMALGFGFPYILLILLPSSWIILPKPGIWMKTLKSILGWGMYSTGLWLVWILLEHINVLPYFLLVPLIGILFRKKRLFWLSLSVFVAMALSLLYFSTSKMTIPFDGEEKIQEHLINGKIVIAKITAKWCLTCQLIDHTLFQDPDVIKIVNDSKVEIMRGDWTKPNPTIDSYLKSRNRLGIPLIVIYGPKNTKGVTLSEFPSKQEILTTLQDVGWSKIDSSK